MLFVIISHVIILIPVGSVMTTDLSYLSFGIFLFSLFLFIQEFFSFFIIFLDYCFPFLYCLSMFSFISIHIYHFLLCSFPIAAFKYYHRLSGSNNTTVLPSSSVARNSSTVLPGPPSGDAGLCLWGSSEEVCFLARAAPPPAASARLLASWTLHPASTVSPFHPAQRRSSFKGLL